MGMYDSVIVKCPACGKDIEFQSKAGECSLKRYSYKSVPLVVAYDIKNDVKSCNCGELIAFFMPELEKRVRMFVSSKYEKEEFD